MTQAILEKKTGSTVNLAWTLGLSMVIHGSGAAGLLFLSSHITPPGSGTLFLKKVWIESAEPHIQKPKPLQATGSRVLQDAALPGSSSTDGRSPSALSSKEVNLSGAEATQLGQSLGARIQEHLGYPKALAQKGVGGQLLLELEFSQSGESLNARVVKPSGYAELDEAALDATRKAAPFTELTRAYLQNEGETLTIRVPFIFDPDL